MEIHVDARRLARSWLATYVAAERRTGWAAPSMVRTMHIEAFTGLGVRLMCTDGALLLVSWVPFDEWEPEPGPEVTPDLRATAHDVDDRLAGLMGYLVDLTNPKGSDDPPEIQVSLGLDVVVEDGEHRLDGLAPRYVTLTYPGREVVRVRVMDTLQPDWRAAMHRYVPDATYEIMLNPNDMKRIAKAGTWIPGPLKAQFQGETGAIRLLWPKADPLHMTGMVLPVRNWRIVAEPPKPEAQPELVDIAETNLAALGGLTTIEMGGATWYVDADGNMLTPDQVVAVSTDLDAVLDD